MSRGSLNGGATRALTEAGRAALWAVYTAPLPLQSLNPGIRDRLTRGNPPLCEVVHLPSPYTTHKDAPIPHLRITAAGRAELGEGPEDSCASCARRPGEVNHPRGMVFIGWGRGWERCMVCGGTTRRPPVQR